MRYWWVNQNQTFDQEFGGGYIWSPKRKSNDQHNPFYEFMREVAPGDAIFSFAGTLIPALGIAQSTAYEAPKPAEFGSAGPNWSDIGWKVSVCFFSLRHRIRPADDMNTLRPLLPTRYSPLQANGNGNQGVYLTLLPDQLALALIELIGSEARDLINANRMEELRDREYPDPIRDVIEWEDHISQELQSDQSLADTERKALVLARRGQGLFKTNVRTIESRCRVTGVDKLEHLIASHTKPWRDCKTNDERLDGENGLLLTPSIDHLFDRGYISFEDTGRLLISPVAHTDSLHRMGVDVASPVHVGDFSSGQKQYLDYHRERVFLESRVTGVLSESG